jgi:hypothetical protein
MVDSMLNKQLHINFVSHLNPFHYFGGGEQYTNRLIKEGIKRNHIIHIISMQPDEISKKSIIERFKNPDLWILFDVFNCPDEKKHFSKELMEEIVGSRKYVFGQNAYGDICYLNALPCNGHIGDGSYCTENKKMYFKLRDNSRKAKWYKGYCPIKDNKYLFTQATLNIFLSPLHAQVFHRIYPETIKKTFILKPLLDIDNFYNKNIIRDIKYASYGGAYETKGFYNLYQRFPSNEIVFIGTKNGGLAEKYGYGKNLGRIPFEQMPDFLNRVEYYVHMPRWPEANGLIVNQAALCGCKLITNEFVGAMTHAFNMYDRNAYKNHAAEFWEKIESIF